MVSRLPDLFWDIQTGRLSGEKVSKAGMPMGAVQIVAFLLVLLSLPLTWYSLCKWTR